MAVAVGRAMARGRWQQGACSCQRCGAEFRSSIATLLEHHCRLCGRTFCGTCSDKKLLLLPPAEGGGSGGSGGGAEPGSERACRGCYELHVGRAAAVASEPVRRATTLPSGELWRMAWMFEDAGDPETGLDFIDKPLKWFAQYNPGRWEGGRYGEGSPPVEMWGMMRRLAAGAGHDAGRGIRIWTNGEGSDRTFSNAAEAAGWIEQQARTICYWTSPQSDSARWATRPADTNLAHLQPVRVRDLIRAPQHNGKWGEVHGAYDESKQRYTVKLLPPDWIQTSSRGGDAANQMLMIRPENLSVVAFDPVLRNEPSTRAGYLPEAGQSSTALDTAADERLERIEQLQASASKNQRQLTGAADRPLELGSESEPERVPEPEPEPEPESAYMTAWHPGDRALYQRSSNSEPVLVTVVRVTMPPGEIPSIIVRMPSQGASGAETERDTTPARLSQVPEPSCPGVAYGSAGAQSPATATPRAQEAVLYSYEWQDVPEGASVPPGMAYTLPLAEGEARQARIPPAWQLQLWSEQADAFYRVTVQRAWTIAQVEAALEAEGPSLPQSMQRKWGPVKLASAATAACPGLSPLAQGLTVETSQLFNLKQAGALVLLHEQDLNPK